MTNEILNSVHLILSICVLFYVSNFKKYLSDRFLRSKDLGKEAKEQSGENAPIGLVTVNEEGTILSSNRYMNEVFGYHERHVIDKNFQILFAPEQIDQIDWLKRFHSAANDNSTIEFEAINKAGKIIPVEVSVSRSDANNYIFYIVVLKDISHRKNNEIQYKILHEDYRTDCELLRDGERIIKCGTWFWNLTKKPDTVIYSDGFAVIFEVPPGQTVTASFLMEAVDIRDRLQVDKIMKEAILDNKNYEMTYRIGKRNHQIDLVRCRGEVQRNENGKTIKVKGTIQIIQENVA